MKWIAKAIVQKTISFLPFSHKVNYLFQKYITKGVRLRKEFVVNKIAQFEKHYSYFQKHAGNAPKLVIELGSGWYPIIPILFFLKSFDKIITVDISKHFSQKAVRESCRMLLEILNETFKLKDFDSGRIDSIQIVADREEWNLEEQLKKLNIQYLNICGSDLPIESSSLGLICSNNTLEHINSTILEKIFIEFKRIKSPLGIMSHFIDMSDHFAHLDNQISAFNFLKFSPGAWKMIDNSLQPQNRLRIADYRALHRNANFEILDEIDTNGKNEDVDQQEIADCFKKIKKEDLFVTHSHIVSI